VEIVVSSWRIGKLAANPATVAGVPFYVLCRASLIVALSGVLTLCRHFGSTMRALAIAIAITVTKLPTAL